MKNVVLALLSSLTLVGCAGVRVNTPPTALPKLPCAVVMDETDEESGQSILGLICDKPKLLGVFKQWEGIDAWQKDAWQKCGPRDGKAQK